MAKRPFRARSPRRLLQWYGGANLIDVETTVSTALSDVTILRPAHTDLDSVRAKRIERIILDFSIRRSSVLGVNAMAYICAVQETDTVGVINDVLEPLGSDPYVYANTDIMHTQCLPIPAIAPTFGGEVIVDVLTREIMCVHVDFKPRRKIDLARHCVSLTVAADSGSRCEIYIRWRMLMSSAA